MDLRDNKKVVRLLSRMQSETRLANLRAISFRIGEDLGESESWRLKKQMRLQKARLGETELAFAQEDWEGGFTVFLPAVAAAGSKLDFEFLLQGDFMFDPDFDCRLPLSPFNRVLVSASWLPRSRDVRYDFSSAKKTAHCQRGQASQRRA